MRITKVDIRNFGCFGKASGAEPGPEAAVCVAGGAGTGKSTVLGAISFMGWFASTSFSRDQDKPLPCRKFLSPQGERNPMTLSMDFEAPATLADPGADASETRMHRYSIVLAKGAARKRGRADCRNGEVREVMEETLSCDRKGNGRMARLLHRKGGANPEIKTAQGVMDGRIRKTLKDILRPDASAFSTLAAINDNFGIRVAVEMGKIFPMAHFLKEPNRTRRGSNLLELLEYSKANPGFLEFLNREIMSESSGIMGVEIMEPGTFFPVALVFEFSGLSEKIMVTQGVMDSGDGFAAGVGPGVPASALAFVRMAPAIHSALANGGVALVDGIDAAGTAIAQRVFDLFTEPPVSRGSNPKRGQIWAAPRIEAVAGELGRPPLRDAPRAAMVRCGRVGRIGSSSVLSPGCAPRPATGEAES